MNWTAFEENIHKRMKKEHIPATAIAVSENGKMIYEKGFGVRDFDTRRPATPETIFGTASVTKSFTALAIMQLAEAGKLSLNDSVCDHLPSFDIKNIEQMKDIKIHHLLTHTTGLAPIERHEKLNQFHEHLMYLREQNHDLLGQPGEYFSYSNDSFLLLGAIIEKVTGRLYRRYMTEEILLPLQMNRSTFSIEEILKMCNVSTPYIYEKSQGNYEKQDWPHLGNYEVGGGIRSSVRDLIKYGRLFLNEGKIGDEQLISRKYLREMYKPHIQIDSRSFYGYGFKVTPNYHGSTLVEHSGGQPGAASNFGFLPEKGISVAVLTNLSGATAGDMWLEAVNTVLDLPLQTKRHKRTERKSSNEEKERFVGEFESGEGQQIAINYENGELTADMDGDTFALAVSDDETLFIKKNEKHLRFYFNNEGYPWAVFVGMRMLLRKEI